jgi:hypothetical protein
MTKRAQLSLAVCLCVSIAGPLMARERPPAPKPTAQKNGAGVLAHPIEPMKPREERPRAGWNGFYGGLNAGGSGSAGAGDANQ